MLVDYSRMLRQSRLGRGRRRFLRFSDCAFCVLLDCPARHRPILLGNRVPPFKSECRNRSGNGDSAFPSWIKYVGNISHVIRERREHRQRGEKRGPDTAYGGAPISTEDTSYHWLWSLAAINLIDNAPSILARLALKSPCRSLRASILSVTFKKLPFTSSRKAWRVSSIDLSMRRSTSRITTFN